MTIDEFKNTKFVSGMYVVYLGKEYEIVTCSFREFLFGLDGVSIGADEPTWVRCENVELVK